MRPMAETHLPFPAPTQMVYRILSMHLVGRFLDDSGAVAWPRLDQRTVGLPLEDLARKPFRMGIAAGAGRGPIALAAIRAGVVNVLACDDTTAGWVLAHG